MSKLAGISLKFNDTDPTDPRARAAHVGAQLESEGYRFKVDFDDATKTATLTMGQADVSAEAIEEAVTEAATVAEAVVVDGDESPEDLAHEQEQLDAESAESGEPSEPKKHRGKAKK